MSFGVARKQILLAMPFLTTFLVIKGPFVLLGWITSYRSHCPLFIVCSTSFAAVPARSLAQPGERPGQHMNGKTSKNNDDIAKPVTHCILCNSCSNVCRPLHQVYMYQSAVRCRCWKCEFRPLRIEQGFLRYLPTIQLLSSQKEFSEHRRTLQLLGLG